MKQITNTVYSSASSYRLRELDFLRGCAIILVLLGHRTLFTYTKTMGWIGVDLFFVLSGFLVGGLLFREYLKFGNVNPWLFLIRRGFKIYPIYYLTYPLYVLPLLLNDGAFPGMLVLSDLLFIQNYVLGWGYAYAASWSLAVEEHFYIGFALVLWFGTKRGWISAVVHDVKKGLTTFEIVIFGVLVLCLLLRALGEIHEWTTAARSFTMTHLRIDSLLVGVLIAYWYYYRLIDLKKFYSLYRPYLFFIALIGLSWTPFFMPLSTFARTIGFTLLYMSFGILLLAFLFTENINAKLDKWFSEHIALFVARIGYASYSIYVIHTLVNTVFDLVFVRLEGPLNGPLAFFLTSGISIAIGMVLTFKVESYFLKIRDRRFPSRVKNVIKAEKAN